jgi:hypothetical protein
MSKKPSLATALHAASGRKPAPTTATDDMSAVSQPTALPPSRKGKKIISGYFDPAAARQLKQLALDNDTTAQALLTEALNDLLVFYPVCLLLRTLLQ